VLGTSQKYYREKRLHKWDDNIKILEKNNQNIKKDLLLKKLR
jgi:hypothetical protein